MLEWDCVIAQGASDSSLAQRLDAVEIQQVQMYELNCIETV